MRIKKHVKNLIVIGISLVFISGCAAKLEPHFEQCTGAENLDLISDFQNFVSFQPV